MTTERSTDNTNAAANKYQGLQGWLLLVVFYIVLWPVMFFLYLSDMYTIFSSGDWFKLIAADSELYNPAFAGLLLVEVAVYLFLAVGSVILLYLLLRESRRVPTLLIAIALTYASYLVGSFIFTGVFVDATIVNHSGAIQMALFGVLQAMVLVTYFLRSRRVRQTFVY